MPDKEIFPEKIPVYQVKHYPKIFGLFIRLAIKHITHGGYNKRLPGT